MLTIVVALHFCELPLLLLLLFFFFRGKTQDTLSYRLYKFSSKKLKFKKEIYWFNNRDSAKVD